LRAHIFWSVDIERRPPSQGWKTFLHNHADGIASMDLFVVPTISFRLLYGLPSPQDAFPNEIWRVDEPGGRV
jgi:hypothetical protein